MEKFEVDGILYNTTSEYTVEVTSRENKYTGDISIPSTIVYNTKNYDVTSIRNWAFSGCSGLTSIDIPNSVTSIGDWAFERCSRLTSIVIPDSVTSIGEVAFSGCSGLESIVIPDSVTSIGDFAFLFCSGLKSIVIPDSVTSIGDKAFCDCSGLKSIKVESGNKYYDSRNDCNAIINSSTNELIAGCVNTVIPDSVTSIGEWAFERCSGLKSIVIPDSVTSIGKGAFYDCRGLKSIVIPNSVTNIGDCAFIGCSGLASIKVDAKNKCYDSRNDCNAIINSKTNELIAGCVNTIIPNSVTSIGEGAFWGCSGLKSIVIPKSVTSIGECAFKGCSRLTSIVIPDNVTSIGNWAFSDCKRLKDVYNYSCIPQSIEVDPFDSNPIIHVPKGCADEYRVYFCWEAHTIIDDIIIIESIHLDQAKYHCDIKCAITPELIVVPEQDTKELKQEWSVSDSSIAFIDGKTGLFVGLGTGKVNICVKVTGDDGKEFTATAEVVVGDVCEAPEITSHNGKITCRSKTAEATCHYTYKYIGLEDGRGENYGEVTPQIEITAYASAEGYNDSETVCKTFDLFPVTIVKNTIVTNEQQGTDGLPF